MKLHYSRLTLTQKQGHQKYICESNIESKAPLESLLGLLDKLFQLQWGRAG